MLAGVRPVQAASYNTLKNGGSHKCLDVPGGNYYLGQKVQQYTCNGGQNQLWTITHWVDGAVGICSSVGYPKWCVGRQQVAGNGAKAVLVYDGGSDYGRWWENNVYSVLTFTSLYDLRCLDDSNQTANGVWMEVYTCNGGWNQKWSGV
jgi:hypothetical protein